MAKNLLKTGSWNSTKPPSYYYCNKTIRKINNDIAMADKVLKDETGNRKGIKAFKMLSKQMPKLTNENLNKRNLKTRQEIKN